MYSIRLNINPTMYSSISVAQSEHETRKKIFTID